MIAKDLAKAISEVTGMSSSKCMKVISAIRGAIKKGLERDGIVTITNLGRFYVAESAGRVCHVRLYADRYVGKYTVYRLPRKVVRFRASAGLRRSMDDGA